MNINKIVKDSVSSIKNKYDNTQLNPFKMPEKLKIELVINYNESFKTLDIKTLSNIFKQIKAEVDKELK